MKHLKFVSHENSFQNGINYFYHVITSDVLKLILTLVTFKERIKPNISYIKALTLLTAAHRSPKSQKNNKGLISLI